jgi:uncharacterized protein YyaL (SSP411 family)
MVNLPCLGRITGDSEFEATARIGRAFGREIAGLPSAHAQMLLAADFALEPSAEVVIVGDPGGADTQQTLRSLRSHFLPDKVVLLRTVTEADSAISRIAEFTRSMRVVHGRATAYVCRNYVCQRPTNDPGEMMRVPVSQ